MSTNSQLIVNKMSDILSDKVLNTRKSYTNQRKLEIVSYAEIHGNSAAAHFYFLCISRTRV